MDNKVACKHCGEMIDADIGFCPICGAVNKRSFKEDPEKEYCVFCGSELGDSEAFCKVCGTPVRRKLTDGDEEKKTSIGTKPGQGPLARRPAATDASENAEIGITDTSENAQTRITDTSENAETGTTDANKTSAFLRKAELKGRENAAREEEYEKLRREETRAFQEEREKLRVSATRAFVQGSQMQEPGRFSGQAAGNGGKTGIYEPKSAFAASARRKEESNSPVGGSVRQDGASGKQTFQDKSADPAEMERMRIQAAEAGVSIEEIRLFEQAKASFDSENETYPDDYNVNDYAQFDYSQSRYGAYNLGSLDLETMEIQNQAEGQTGSQPENARESRGRKDEKREERGVIGVKKKKTPLLVRLLVFFIAIFAVAGLAGIILYVVPVVQNVHPKEIFVEDSIVTDEVTITPLPVTTATPTPSPTPSPTPMPTPTVNAIIPQSITPSPVAEKAPVPASVGGPAGDEAGYTAMEIPDVEVQESGFVIPDSDTRVMDPSELDGRSPEEIRLIANEIYARYGYIFRNGWYVDYFGKYDWYDPTVSPEDFSEDDMSEAAQANITMIAEYEAEHGY
ncbi:MAG: YARHG domain-containing protein [Lachnospiraceae bacterium]|nr:YARHG domain-containing protein [Lachnospiraceae bacterium]